MKWIKVKKADKIGFIVIFNDNMTYLKYDTSDSEFDINTSDYMTYDIKEAKVYSTYEEAEKASYFADDTRVIDLKPFEQNSINEVIEDKIIEAIGELNLVNANKITKEQLLTALNNIINNIDKII